MKKNKVKKEYCVHVYPRPYEYENIMAESPQDAELKALDAGGYNDWEDIQSVEVMRTCKCGLDNDTANKKCDDCGAKL